MKLPSYGTIIIQSTLLMLCFKPISDHTKQKFYGYFAKGYSPSTARHHHTMLLAIEYEGDEKGLEQAHADRSVNPLPKDITFLPNGDKKDMEK